VDRLTRKELKTDKFAQEVSHTVEFLEEHRRQAMIIGAVVVAVILAVLGGRYYLRIQKAERQQALRQAERIYQAQIGPATNAYLVFYPTEEAKKEAVEKAFGEIIQKYPRSEEAAVAKYYLGAMAIEQGNYDEARKRFEEVAASGKQPYASQAALSLAQLYAGEGKLEEAEKLLRELVARPTELVSKEQATIALAQVIAKTKPEEARKLLEPLRTERSAVSRAAIAALANVPKPDQQ
jgi:TolA-binding protein